MAAKRRTKRASKSESLPLEDRVRDHKRFLKRRLPHLSSTRINNFVDRYMAKHGYPPLLDEVAKAANKAPKQEGLDV